MHPFINRLLCFMLAIALVVALAVPVFASSAYSEYLEIPDDILSQHSYFTIFDYNSKNNSGSNSGSMYLIGHNHPMYYKVSKGEIFFNCTADDAARMTTYKWKSGKWSYEISTGTGPSYSLDSGFANHIVWANYTINDDSGSTYFVGTPIVNECDGTSCPATDANHDNICDDCGKVLAYNLRSTLLDYAKSRAETYTDYPYYAVVEHMTFEGSLLVYLSKTPMYAEPPDYDTVYGTNLSWFQVNTNEDGSFTHTVRNSSSPWTGNLVYSNHEIENFLKPPLTVVIQGVTGEALEVEIPSLIAEMKIIVLCGVGCLALLILLVLLSKKSKTFLKG